MTDNNEKVIPNVDSKSKEERNVPDLRYLHLCDISEPISYGLGASAIKYDGVNQYIRITDIDDISGRIGNPTKVSPSYLDDKCLLQKDDILVARTGASVGKSYFHTISDKSYYAGFLMRLRIIKHNPYYIYQQLKTNKYEKYVEIMSQRSGQPGINAKELGKYTIRIDSIEKENKIANVFANLDLRINTQKKIIEDYELLKKQICNKIYNSNLGTKYSLKDVLKERKIYAQKDDEYEHVTLSKDGIFPKTDRYDRDFLVKDENKEYKITKINDLCYNPANLKFGVICQNKYGNAIFSPIYVTYEINKAFNPDYVCMLLTNASFIKKIRKYEQGTVYERMAVNPEDFIKGEIYIPTKELQDNSIDKINTLEEKFNEEKKILSLYEKQKQYLLNHIFI